MQLSQGKVTQNGSWISYKTEQRTESINDFQQMANELREYLDKREIKTHSEYFAAQCVNSTRRKGCVTIKAYSDDYAMNALPFESHSVD